MKGAVISRGAQELRILSHKNLLTFFPAISAAREGEQGTSTLLRSSGLHFKCWCSNLSPLTGIIFQALCQCRMFNLTSCWWLSSLLAAAVPLRVADSAQTLLQQDRVSIFPAQMKFHSQVLGCFICWRGVTDTVGELRPGRRQQDEGGFRHRMKIVKLALKLP